MDKGSRLSSSQVSTPSDDAPAVPSAAMKRLRTQVRRATEEIERLRAENRALKERVQELETRPAIGEDEAFLTLDDPDALREQIEGFIDTIDAYLDDHDASPEESA